MSRPTPARWIGKASCDLNFEAPNAIDKYPPEMAEECLRLLAAVGRYFEKRITEE